MAGLQERRKRRTRAQIAEVAMRLFLERGFDQVSVGEIAEAAEVAEKTVYNHFPVKANLVFDEDPALLEGMVSAIRRRGPGVSAAAALREYLPTQADRLGQAEPPARHRAFRHMILHSPALRAHQRAMAARYESELAGELAAATGTPADAPEPFVAAVALVGAVRAGFETGPRAGGVAAAITRALDLLDAGLGRYATATDYYDPHHDDPRPTATHNGQPRPARS